MRVKIVFITVVSLALVSCGPPRQAGGSASLATRVVSSPWSSSYSGGQLITTDHYKIYTTSQSPMVLRYLPGFMEASHQNYLRLTQLPPRKQQKHFPIYMMATRDEWVVLTRNIVGGNRDTYLAIQAGGYFYKGVCVFWDLGGLGTFSVAAHEGFHQFLHHRLRDRLPMWLEEGLCVSSEAHQILGERVRFTPDTNAFRFSSLRSGIIRQYWKPIGELIPLDAGNVITGTSERAVSYYAQLWVLSTFLRSHPVYSKGFRRMMADAEAGRMHEALGLPPIALVKLRRRGRTYNQTVSEPLFRYYINNDLDAFEREYFAFAKKVANLK